MKKRILILATIFSLISQIASASCLQKYERVFFNIKAMQSSMMVAALTCDLRTDYNYFMQRYGPILNESGRWIENHFINTYGYNGYQRPLNSFSTTLANNASNISNNMDYDQYCLSSKKQINALNNFQDSDILYLVLGINKYENVHQMGLCYQYNDTSNYRAMSSYRR